MYVTVPKDPSSAGVKASIAYLSITNAAELNNKWKVAVVSSIIDK